MDFLRVTGAIFCAAALSIVSTSTWAHSGDLEFLTSELVTKTASRAKATGATTATLELEIQGLANVLSFASNAAGKTLLPKGTVCEAVELLDGKLVVRYLLPPGYDRAAFSEGVVDTVSAVFTQNFASEFGLSEVRVVAREAASEKSIESYQTLDSFAPELSKAVASTEIPAGESPATPAPDYEKEFAELARGLVSENNKNVPGQSAPGSHDQPVGVLTGRVVYLGAGHGRAYNSTSNVWGYERPFIWSMNEDSGNQDMITFTANVLFNAGATVVPTRPVGFQPLEAVVDDVNATYTGTWTSATGSTDNFGDASGNSIRFTSTAATPTHAATFTPNIPAAGWYPVYGYANASGNRTSKQIYQVKHSAGTSRVPVNHRRVGRGWIYLGTYYFSAGSNAAIGSVVIDNQLQPGATAGVVIADAVRFGNGIGNTVRGPGISGVRREMESNIYWANSAEAPSSVTFPGSNDASGNSIGGPPRMARYMHQDDGQGYNAQLYLGYHTNASNGSGTVSGSARGSVGLITNSGSTPVTNQPAFAALTSNILDEEAFVEDANWESVWGNYGLTVITSAYGEISNTSLAGTMCATIIEVAFHDNTVDSQLLRDPKVRYVAARSQMHAIIRYFADFGGGSLSYPPLHPERVRARNAGDGTVNVQWAPVAAATPAPLKSQAATGYRVYSSPDGLNFGNPVEVNGIGTTSVNISGLPANVIRYFRVAAFNGGGEGPASEVLAVRVRAGQSPVLVVNGYDRIDRLNNVNDSQGPANNQRIRLRNNNSYDYVRQHGKAIAAAGYHFDTTSNEAVISNDVNLANYQTVVWISGEESTADDTFNATEQSRVTTFLSNNGKGFFVSGAEVGYEMVATNQGASFFQNVLRSQYVADDANTYSVSGIAGQIYAGVSLSFAPGADTYDADFPDTLAPNADSVAVMQYAGGATAATAYSAGTSRVITFGFPFELIVGELSQNQIMQNSLTFLGPQASTAVQDYQLYSE